MLGQRVLSSVGVVIVGVVPALFGVWGAVAAFAVLGVIALTELRSTLRQIDHTVLMVIALPAILVALVAVAAGWPAWVFSALVAWSLLGPACLLVTRPTLDGALPAWLATMFASLYIAVPLGHIVAVRQIAGVAMGAGGWLTRLEDSLGFRDTTLGLSWFLLAIITTWLSDSLAYLSGRAFGKHLMAPVISPKKTWEGFAGGVVGAILTALVTNWCFGVGMRVVVAAVVGLVIACVAAVGDLAESLIKRQAGVKDMGTLIPGHGGVLDRIDSQLFVFVLVYYVALAVR
jgi:phosphatidate cytidylyltransferase